VGETVLGTFNNAGSVIMVIADLSRMLMRARVDETNIAPVQAGQKAKVYVLSYPDEHFEGVVQRVHLTREIYQDGTNFVEAEILVQKAEGELRFSGLNANADIEVQTLRDVVIVPSQAVADRRIDEMDVDVVRASPFADTGRTFARVVYRFVDGKAVATPVSVGSSDLTRTVILGGLSTGDEIITGPYRVLADLKHDADVRRVAEGAAEGEGDDAGAGEADGEQPPEVEPASEAAAPVTGEGDS